MIAGCEFCGCNGSGARPPCHNLADMQGWAGRGDSICEEKLKERLAKWTLSESGLCLSRTTVAA